MNISRKTQLQLIADCGHREFCLSDWEQIFINSLNHQLSQGRSLTVRQNDILNQIWDKATRQDYNETIPNGS